MDSLGPNWVFTHSYLILLLPLSSFLLGGLWLGRKSPRYAAGFAVLASGSGFLLSLFLARAFHANMLDPSPQISGGAALAWEFPWLSLLSSEATGSYGDSQAGLELIGKMGFYLDPISVMMVCVITFISFLVNVYSLGYMKNDPGAGRFFPLLSFFSFAMLGLVVSTNTLQLFVFWELVGAASYLLIGFWYAKPAAVAAAKKAFVITRCADVFFLLGILLLSYYGRSFDFLVLNAPETARLLDRPVVWGALSVNLLTLATLLMFCGGWGKSAMFPLHVWLPDAMEGPTPVSSLIHSATMVVAGVYLTARMFPLFAEAETTLRVAEAVGAFTALFAAVIACTQTDLKRILAFSTLSQLGFMMFALGAAAPTGSGISGEEQYLGYVASMFHIFTHAFFKCLLFLSAGILIHALHTGDIRAFAGWGGRLRRKMPITYGSTLIACLAIAGIWPFSGFFSKDAILLAALENGRYVTFAVGLATGGLTAFYMFRYFFLIFHARPSHAFAAMDAGDRGREGAIKENPYMALPMAVLAIPSALAGWLGMDYFFTHFLPPIAGPPIIGVAPEGASHFAWLPFAAMAIGMAGAVSAWLLYHGKATADPETRGFWHRMAYNKFHIDAAYLFFARGIVLKRLGGASRWLETYVVDGMPDLFAALMRMGGGFVRLLQNGHVQFYAGMAVVGLYLVYFLGGASF